MPILATGTTLPTNIVFNSGIFNINGTDLAVLQDITVTLNWSTKEIRALGSLKMVTAPKRSTFKAGAKGKVKSMNAELFSYFMGSSAVDGSGYAYNVLDGQNVLSICAIKCIVNDDVTKIAEFQFTNATLAGALAIGLKMEDAAENDFEIQAQDVTLVRSGF